MAGTTDPALLAAQAKAGKAGVDAYEAAKTELAAQKQQAIATALAESASRGGPAGAGATIGATISAPYDQHIAALTAAQARTSDAVAGRDLRMADYNASVDAARGLIGDQIRQTVAPIDARSNFQIRQLETQGRNQVQGIEANMRLTAAQGEARQAEWERQQAEAAAKAAAAAAKGSGGGGGGGGGSDKKPKLNEGELKGLLTEGAIAKIQAAIANAGGFLENKNSPAGRAAAAAAKAKAAAPDPNHTQDPRFIGTSRGPVTSPRNTVTANQRGTGGLDPLHRGNPAVPVAGSNPATIADPRFRGGPAVPVTPPRSTPAQRPAISPNHVMDPRVIGNPAVPVNTPNRTQDPRFRGGPAVPARPPINPDHVMDPRLIGGPAVPTNPPPNPNHVMDPLRRGAPAVRPAANPNNIPDPRFIGDPALTAAIANHVQDPRLIGGPAVRPAANPNNVMDPRFIGEPAVSAQQAAALAAERAHGTGGLDPRIIGGPAVPVRPERQDRETVRNGPGDHVLDPRVIGGPAVPTTGPRGAPTPDSLAKDLVSYGGARPSGPGDATYSGDDMPMSFSPDELKFFMGTQEGALYSALVGSGAPAPRNTEDVANIIGSDPEVMQNAMALVAMELQQQGYEIDEGQLAAAMGLDQTYQPGYNLMDVLGVQQGLGTTEDQAKGAAALAKARQDEIDAENKRIEDGLPTPITPGETRAATTFAASQSEEAAAADLRNTYNFPATVTGMPSAEVRDIFAADPDAMAGALATVDGWLNQGYTWDDEKDADGAVVNSGIRTRVVSPDGLNLDPTLDPMNRKLLKILEAYAK